jgi:RND superfamily putative drug exporter
VFAALGRACVRYRYVVVLLWVLVAVVCVRFLPSLNSVVSGQNSDFLPADAPSVVAARLARVFERPNVTNGVVVFAAARGPLTSADEAAASRAEREIADLPGVAQVRDLGVSADGEAREALVQSDVPLFDSSRAARLVGAVRSVLARTERPGLEAAFTGQLPSAVDENRTSVTEQHTTQELSVLFILVLLLLVFRGLLAPFVTLAPAGLALVVAGPLIAEAARAGVEVSVFTQFMLIVLVLGAGTDYGLFLVFRVREEIARGREPRDAVVAALARVGESITFSGTTVVLAFASLLLASFGLYRGLGPGLAIGIAVTLVVDLTLLPALLAIFGRAVFWPRVPRPGSVHEGWWGRVAASVVRRPRMTLGVGLVVFGGLALANLAYAPSGFASTTSAPPGSNSALGERLLAAHFPLAEVNPTNVVLRFPRSVWAEPAELARAETLLGRARVFRSVAGPLDPNGRHVPLGLLVELHRLLGPAALLPPIPRSDGPVPVAAYEAYRATAQFVSPDGRTVQLDAELRAGAPGSTAAIGAVPEVRRAVAAVARRVGATRWGVAGEAAALYDISTISGSDLFRVIPVVLAVILLLLVLLLRSLVAPAYLIVSVGLSYLAALGTSVLVYVVLLGDSGINFILPFFMFVFLMALGEDYNILVMSRIREEAHDLPLPAAVRAAIGTTGTTVTSAGLILAGTFLVLTVATTGSVRQVGIGLAVGVLLDTFLVRSLLVPSAVVLLGKWSWWPSDLFHRHHTGHLRHPRPVVDRTASTT